MNNVRPYLTTGLSYILAQKSSGSGGSGLSNMVNKLIDALF